MKKKNQVTLENYEPKNGNKPSKLPNKRELVGYMPLEKRIAELKAAGLRTAYDRDKKFFDYVKGEVEIDFIPPLPRHIPADLADVSALYREYAARKKEIEEKIALKQSEKVKEPETIAEKETKKE